MRRAEDVNKYPKAFIAQSYEQMKGRQDILDEYHIRQDGNNCVSYYTPNPKNDGTLISTPVVNVMKSIFVQLKQSASDQFDPFLHSERRVVVGVPAVSKSGEDLYKQAIKPFYSDPCFVNEAVLAVLGFVDCHHEQIADGERYLVVNLSRLFSSIAIVSKNGSYSVNEVSSRAFDDQYSYIYKWLVFKTYLKHELLERGCNKELLKRIGQDDKRFRKCLEKGDDTFLKEINMHQDMKGKPLSFRDYIKEKMKKPVADVVVKLRNMEETLTKQERVKTEICKVLLLYEEEEATCWRDVVYQLFEEHYPQQVVMDDGDFIARGAAIYNGEVVVKDCIKKTAKFGYSICDGWEKVVYCEKGKLCDVQTRRRFECDSDSESEYVDFVVCKTGDQESYSEWRVTLVDEKGRRISDFDVCINCGEDITHVQKVSVEDRDVTQKEAVSDADVSDREKKKYKTEEKTEYTGKEKGEYVVTASSHPLNCCYKRYPLKCVPLYPPSPYPCLFSPNRRILYKLGRGCGLLAETLQLLEQPRDTHEKRHIVGIHVNVARGQAVVRHPLPRDLQLRLTPNALSHLRDQLPILLLQLVDRNVLLVNRVHLLRASVARLLLLLHVLRPVLLHRLLDRLNRLLLTVTRSTHPHKTRDLVNQTLFALAPLHTLLSHRLHLRVQPHLVRLCLHQLLLQFRIARGQRVAVLRRKPKLRRQLLRSLKRALVRARQLVHLARLLLQRRRQRGVQVVLYQQRRLLSLQLLLQLPLLSLHRLQPRAQLLLLLLRLSFSPIHLHLALLELAQTLQVVAQRSPLQLHLVLHRHQLLQTVRRLDHGFAVLLRLRRQPRGQVDHLVLQLLDLLVLRAQLLLHLLLRHASLLARLELRKRLLFLTRTLHSHLHGTQSVVEVVLVALGKRTVILHHHGPLQTTDHSSLLPNQILFLTPPRHINVLVVQAKKQFLHRQLRSHKTRSLRLRLARERTRTLHPQLLLTVRQVRKQVVAASTRLLQLLHYS